MSYYESLDVVSMVIGEALEKYDIVHINGGTRLIKPVGADLAAEGICGIAQEGGAIGETVALAIGGVSKVVAGATITVGDQIGSDANANAVPLVAGTRMIGIALVSALAGDVLPAIVYVGEKKA